MELTKIRKSAFNVAVVVALIVLLSRSELDPYGKVSNITMAICFLVLAIPQAFETFCCLTTNSAVTTLFTFHKSEQPIAFLSTLLLNVATLSILVGGAIYLV